MRASVTCPQRWFGPCLPARNRRSWVFPESAEYCRSYPGSAAQQRRAYRSRIQPLAVWPPRYRAAGRRASCLPPRPPDLRGASGHPPMQRRARLRACRHAAQPSRTSRRIPRACSRKWSGTPACRHWRWHAPRSGRRLTEDAGMLTSRPCSNRKKRSQTGARICLVEDNPPCSCRQG